METKINSIVSALQKELLEEQKNLKLQRTEIEAKKKAWEESDIGLKEKIHFPTKIKLDVGGQLFTTSLSTLTQIGGTFFSAMFSGKIKVVADKDGSFFIDRDPLVFPMILNFLRGIFPDFKVLSKKEIFALRNDSQYYELDDLEALIDEVFKRKTWVWLPESRCQLKNENKTVTKTGGSTWDCVVMSSEDLSGVVVWEYIFDRVSSDRSGMAVGICRSDTSPGSYSSVIGFGMTGSGYSGVTIVNSSLIVSATKIRAKANFETNRIDFYVDKTQVATGTIPSGGVYKCCVFLYYTSDQVTLNFDVEDI